MKQKELSTTELDRLFQHRIRSQVRINPKDRRHYQRITSTKRICFHLVKSFSFLSSLPVTRENTSKMSGDVYVNAETESQHQRVFTMQNERAVDDV